MHKLMPCAPKNLLLQKRKAWNQKAWPDIPDSDKSLQEAVGDEVGHRVSDLGYGHLFWFLLWALMCCSGSEIPETLHPKTELNQKPES